MSACRDEEELLELGDQLFQRGKLCLAAKAYCRYADAWLARRLLLKARKQVSSKPLGALHSLARVETLSGASNEGRTLAAEAYEALGQPEVANRFRLANTMRNPDLTVSGSLTRVA